MCLLPKADLDIDILDGGDRDEARKRWRKNCSKWGCFQNTSLSIRVK